MDAHNAQQQMKAAIIGVIGTGSGVLFSLALVEQYLRLASAGIGVIIGLVSLWRMFRKPKRK